MLLLHFQGPVASLQRSAVQVGRQVVCTAPVSNLLWPRGHLLAARARCTTLGACGDRHSLCFNGRGDSFQPNITQEADRIYRLFKIVKKRSVKGKQ